MTVGTEDFIFNDVHDQSSGVHPSINTCRLFSVHCGSMVLAAFFNPPLGRRFLICLGVLQCMIYLHAIAFCTSTSVILTLTPEFVTFHP